MPGPKGKCIRDKAIGKAALGCSGKPNQESMDLSDPIYRSDHCFCAECGGMNALQAMIGSGKANINIYLNKLIGDFPKIHLIHKQSLIVFFFFFFPRFLFYRCFLFFSFRLIIFLGLHKKIVWTAYCHTRGLNSCHCGLVDMSIKDEKTCYDLW